ncbi:MAG: glycosyltransferase family 2 protein [Chloroflexi bacterium]|nr:glycosyltransferase family 2 protein [Chloroflexota bacterium]
MPKLTVIILTLNEEVNLPLCLQSIRGLTADVFVLDSGSTDRTVEIAKAAGAVVAAHPFENYGAQRNWAQQHMPKSTEWVLHLDADERLTPELVTEINSLMTDPPPQVNGFLLRKRTYFMGKWMRHGGHYPSYHLRLLRPAHGRCENRLYDQHFVVDGAVKRLHHDYIDVVASDLTTWTLRHVRWAGMEAQELEQERSGKDQVQPKMLGNPVQRRRWLRVSLYGNAPLFLRAWLYWFYRYFVRLGFLDGREGLIFHFLQGCWFRFQVDSRIYEERARLKTRRAK